MFEIGSTAGQHFVTIHKIRTPLKKTNARPVFFPYTIFLPQSYSSLLRIFKWTIGPPFLKFQFVYLPREWDRSVHIPPPPCKCTGGSEEARRFSLFYAQTTPRLYGTGGERSAARVFPGSHGLPTDALRTALHDLHAARHWTLVVSVISL